MKLKIFHVYGPFDVPLEQAKKYKYIPSDCPEFWQKHPHHIKERGCYIFGFRAAKGFRPVYVGKTKLNFRKEVFTSHKITQHYAPALADTVKGTPVLFFVIAAAGKGPTPKKMIGDMETFLIQVGVAKNPNLSNYPESARSTMGYQGSTQGRQR